MVYFLFLRVILLFSSCFIFHFSFWWWTLTALGRWHERYALTQTNKPLQFPTYPPCPDRQGHWAVAFPTPAPTPADFCVLPPVLNCWLDEH